MSIIERNPEAKVLVTPPLYGPDGTRGVPSYEPVTPLNVNRGTLIGKQVSDKKLNRILEIHDWMNFDLEAMVLANFGQPGVHLDWAGEPYKSKPINREGINAEEQAIQHYPAHMKHETMMPLMFGGTPGRMAEIFISTAEGQKVMIRPYRWDLFDETNHRQVQKTYGADLNTIASEYFYKAITGEIEIDPTWDEYVKTWLQAGGQKVLDELSKAPKVSDLRK